MAQTQSHVAASKEHAEKSALTPHEEQVVRMRKGEALPQGAKLELSSGKNEALKKQLLAFEAQILARAPEPKRVARLRLVPSS